jgi:uncharacterized membrane protein YeiH
MLGARLRCIGSARACLRQSPRVLPRWCSTASAPNSSSRSKTDVVDLLARAEELNVRLTPKERLHLEKMADVNGDGTMSSYEYDMLVRGGRPNVLAAERQALQELRESAHDSSLGKKMIVFADYLGTALFAVVGAQTAGMAEMNVVGCTLVGCVAAMGGGTVNNLITGVTPVFWLRDPRFLLLAVLSSVATFYLWPEYESWAATREKLRLSVAAQEEALSRRATLDLRQEARSRVMDSVEVYVVETVALSALGVIGARHGIQRGLPPPACIALGVTICAGGVMRDVLCQRDVAIGSQSFALATGAGACVYVALRQAAERGFVVLISVRVCLAAATTMAQRYIAWERKQSTGEHFLAPYGSRSRSASGRRD